jgi:hypothetical protein
VGHAQDLDGTLDHVELGDSASLSPTTALTIEAWLRPTWATYPVRGMVYTDWKDDPIDAGVSFNFSVEGGRILLAISPEGLIGPENTDHYEGETVLTLSDWNHTAVTFDSGAFNMYVAGLPDAPEYVSDTATTIFDSPNPKTIGVKNIPALPFPFQGYIDEVRISGVARSADWIHAQYRSQIGTFATIGGEQQQ